LGSSLLGRDPWDGGALKRPNLKHLLEEELIERTKKASLYGLHATIVAPFRLNSDEKTLLSALEELLLGEKEIPMPPLKIETPRDAFTALVPESLPKALKDLERKLVVNLNRLRDKEAPLKNRGRLGDRAADYYQKWGYPYVLEEFFFHITLSDAADAKTLAALKDFFPDEALGAFFIDSLCLSRQEDELPFKTAARFPLGLSS
jgi:hypothetical protein